MKKITLAIALLTYGAQAQDFPSPYCEIEDASVEEITLISMAGTSIANTDTGSILVDKTSTVIDVMPEDMYTLRVEGNTYGNFDTNIVAYIDWNQNNILDDDGELFAIGTLTDSDGVDDIFVSREITVPADAVLGNTRIRVTKTYTDFESVAVVNPCAIEMEILDFGAFPGFGQAIDFSLNITTLGVGEFDANALSIYPIPTKDVLNVEYKSVLNTVTVYNMLGQEVYRKNVAAASVKLDISSLSVGTYIVKLVSESGQHSFRVLKD